MIKYIYYFFWLAGQAWSALFYIWPITAGILVLLAIAFVFVIIKRRELLRQNMKFLPVPLAGTILILLAGTIIENKPAFEITALLSACLTVILSGISIYKTKSIWPVSVTSTVLIIWFSFWCLIISSRSILNGWI